jgi:hypothetical protein
MILCKTSFHPITFSNDVSGLENNEGPIENELFRLPVIDEVPLGNRSLPNIEEPDTGMLTGLDTPAKTLQKLHIEQ